MIDSHRWFFEMLARLLVAVFSKKAAEYCDFPTPKSLIHTILEKYFCEIALLLLFGKQFELEGETGIHT